MITICHHSASLVMAIGDPWDGLFYPTLTLMIDSYSIAPKPKSLMRSSLNILFTVYPPLTLVQILE